MLYFILLVLRFQIRRLSYSVDVIQQAESGGCVSSEERIDTDELEFPLSCNEVGSAEEHEASEQAWRPIEAENLNSQTVGKFFSDVAQNPPQTCVSQRETINSLASSVP